MAESPRKRILVVDDESDVADLVAYNLKAKGFDVETVNDPTRSIAVARSFMPDLAVLDVMMPEINGTQICRMMRADPKLKHVPVVFLTAKVEENDRIHGLEIGADDYICKPFSTKELVLRVQNILRRREGKEGDEPVKLIAGSIELAQWTPTCVVYGKNSVAKPIGLKPSVALATGWPNARFRSRLLKRNFGTSCVHFERCLKLLLFC